MSSVQSSTSYDYACLLGKWYLSPYAFFSLMYVPNIIAGPVSGLKDDPWGWLRWIKVEIRASLHDVDSFDGCRSYFAWNRCVCYLILCEAVGVQVVCKDAVSCWLKGSGSGYVVHLEYSISSMVRNDTVLWVEEDSVWYILVPCSMAWRTVAWHFRNQFAFKWKETGTVSWYFGYQVALKGKDTSGLGQESLLNSTKTKHIVFKEMWAIDGLQGNGRRR